MRIVIFECTHMHNSYIIESYLSHSDRYLSLVNVRFCQIMLLMKKMKHVQLNSNNER